MRVRHPLMLLAVLVAAGVISAALPAARGDLDPALGSSGKVTTDFGGNETPWGLAVQQDGKAVVAGTRFDPGPSDDFVLVRYATTGVLDATFDGDGKVTTDFGGRSDGAGDVSVQADGKIVVAGSGFSVPVRPLDFGSLDSSFGGNGVVVHSSFRPSGTYADHVLVQPDGKILTGGAGLVRFNSDGTLDRSFGAGGRAVADMGLVTPVLQPDRKILAVGSTSSPRNFSDFGVVRLTAAGRIDPTYGRGGRVVTNFRTQDDATDAALLPNGKLIVSGYTPHVPFEAPADFAIARHVAIRFCLVPPVRGRNLAASRGRLGRANCRLGKVKRRYSAKVRRGRVISQRPRVGARLAELANVDLVVSRGRRR